MGLRPAGFSGDAATGQCERLDEANPEFSLALLDLRGLGGDKDVYAGCARSPLQSCDREMAQAHRG